MKEMIEKQPATFCFRTIIIIYLNNIFWETCVLQSKPHITLTALHGGLNLVA